MGNDDTVEAIGGLAIGAIIFALGWITRGKKDNESDAKNQEVISKLEERLRINEERLRDTEGLAAEEIARLRKENECLRNELKRERARSAA